LEPKSWCPFWTPMGDVHTATTGSCVLWCAADAACAEFSSGLSVGLAPCPIATSLSLTFLLSFRRAVIPCRRIFFITTLPHRHLSPSTDVRCDFISVFDCSYSVSQIGKWPLRPIPNLGAEGAYLFTFTSDNIFLPSPAHFSLSVAYNLFLLFLTESFWLGESFSVCIAKNKQARFSWQFFMDVQHVKVSKENFVSLV